MVLTALELLEALRESGCFRDCPFLVDAARTSESSPCCGSSAAALRSLAVRFFRPSRAHGAQSGAMDSIHASRNASARVERRAQGTS